MNKFFKMIALSEGISTILLFFVAMPLKYAMGKPEYVKLFGSLHGALFIAYILLAILLKYQNNWNTKQFGLVCLASLVPFGSFYLEKKYL